MICDKTDYSRRALGFCCSQRHAEEMAKEFCSRGVPAVAVYSNAESEFSEDRDKAIQQLQNQEIHVILNSRVLVITTPTFTKRRVVVEQGKTLKL